jgi:hypothetical protein
MFLFFVLIFVIDEVFCDCMNVSGIVNISGSGNPKAQYTCNDVNCCLEFTSAIFGVNLSEPSEQVKNRIADVYLNGEVTFTGCKIQRLNSMDRGLIRAYNESLVTMIV